MTTFYNDTFNDMLRDTVDIRDNKPQRVTPAVPNIDDLNSLSQERDQSPRQKGDSLLYGYYVKTFGLGAFFLWLLLAIIASASSRLPGKLLCTPNPYGRIY